MKYSGVYTCTCYIYQLLVTTSASKAVCTCAKKHQNSSQKHITVGGHKTGTGSEDFITRETNKTGDNTHI